MPLERARDYAAEDAEAALCLHNHFKPRLVAEHLVTVYETIERPLVPVLRAMEAEGVAVDREELRRLSNDFAVRLVDLEKQIYKAAGREFNVGSPTQLGKILFDEMGLQLPGGAKPSKTKTGAYATGADVLEELAAGGHALPRKVLDWRQLAKLKSTYADALIEQINPRTGRVHTSYAMAVASTGRLSSTDPNLQNIPIRTEEGRKIRRAFVAAKGCELLSFDYSQIELRLLAHVADIGALKQAFQRRRGHPRADRLARSSACRSKGMDQEGPQPRQGDQFRHHLRHQRLRPRAPARRSRRARRAPTSTPTSSNTPASATTWSAPRSRRASRAT